MKIRKIGINGLGKMGLAVAERLLELGESIAVHTRNKEKYALLEQTGNITYCQTPKSLIDECGFIINLLFGDQSVEETYLEKDGYLEADLDGKCIIEMTTIKPETAMMIATKVKQKEGIFIESPVSGTVGPARNGKLMALVGADPDDLVLATDVLNLITRKIIHAGAIGQGSMLKLVINLPLAIYWQSIKEAYDLAKVANMDINLVLEALAESGISTRVLTHKIDTIIGNNNECGFDVSMMIKDINCILSVYGEQPKALEALNAAMKSYQDLDINGMNKSDACMIINP
jgi:3-hydroxyisobutyrate dehydrogenase-like beta-hydroxyacid dehydrogenase